jgi:receptor-type tyrosine-protein phosphatase F
MQYEGVIDLLQTVRILRTQRPAMVQTEVYNLALLGEENSKFFLNAIYIIKFVPLITQQSIICALYIPIKEQYEFCYRAALEYLGSFDHYSA